MLGKTEHEVLKFLESGSGRYVGGSVIAKRLGISRAAVSKAVASLRRKGFLIESHPKRGYRLSSSDSLSEANGFLRLLDTKVRFSVHYFKYLPSTQDVAGGLAERGAPEGTVVVAEEMSSGRGRMGRAWHAPPGGLWMTVLLRPGIPPEGMQVLSLLSGVAVAEAINDVSGLRAELKWPNDVLVEGRKVCGILVEASVEADVIDYVLLGIGINVNNDLPEDLKDLATSLRALLRKRIPRVLLLAVTLSRLDALYEEFKRGKVKKILNRWTSLSCTIGREVEAIYRGRTVRGKAIGLREDGSLILRLKDGSLEAVSAGDVVHLR